MKYFKFAYVFFLTVPVVYFALLYLGVYTELTFFPEYAAKGPGFTATIYAFYTYIPIILSLIGSFFTARWIMKK